MNSLSSVEKAKKTTPSMGHWLYLFPSFGGVILGVHIFVFGDPTRFHWAYFSYGFFTVASVAAIGILVMWNHWILRVRFFDVKEIPDLKRTRDFNGAGIINGVLERMVFTTLALILVVSADDGPLHVGGSVGVLASIGGGWVVLKSLTGWRRLKSEAPEITALSMISISASLTSVFVGVLGGVLTVLIFPETF